MRHTRKDGTVIVVSSRQALARDADGQPVAIIELNSDVTEQKRSEAELAYMSGLLERTQVISKTGGWEYDLATRKLDADGGGVPDLRRRDGRHRRSSWTRRSRPTVPRARRSSAQRSSAW